MLKSRPEDALVKLVKTVDTVQTAETACTAHMGQILQDGENACFTSIFFRNRGFL